MRRKHKGIGLRIIFALFPKVNAEGIKHCDEERAGDAGSFSYREVYPA